MDKKVLLIKPPFQTIPVGFAYVMACLEEHDIRFDFIDTTFWGRDYKRLLSKNDYLAVCTGGLIGDYPFFQDIVRQVREYSPGVPVILGGNIIKDIRRDFLFDKIGIDYGVVGEAETSLPFLLKRLGPKTVDLEGLSGLIYRDQMTGEIKKKSSARFDLGKKNIIPAWHHIDLEYYAKDCNVTFYGNRSIMPVLSGRGCVGHCAFCSPTVGVFHSRPLAHVIEEIEYLNAHYDFDWVAFWNEMFYDSKEQIMEFCEAYRKVKPKKPWFCALRTDVNVDRETFLAMKEAGCVSVSAGIESGSDRVLQFMRKNTTKEKTIRFFRLAKEAGMPANGTFLVAHEGETEEDLKETIDMVIGEDMNTGECLTSAYPGTLIYRNSIHKGLIKDELEFLQKFKFGSGVWETDWDKRNYLNTSDIPNDQLWHVLVRQLRRYYTAIFHRFTAHNIRYHTILGSLPIRVQGNCSVCKENVVKDFPEQIIGLEKYCPRCFNRVFFDLYQLKDFSAHFNFICERLKQSSRTLIFGVNDESSVFLRMDIFGVDYQRILGFMEAGSTGEYRPEYINMPCYRLETLMTLAPDLILIIDEKKGQAELILRSYYAQHNIQPPEIIHLWPSSCRWNLRILAAINSWGLERLPGGIYLLALKTLSLVFRGMYIVRVVLISGLRFLKRLKKSGWHVTMKKIICKLKAKMRR